GILATINVVTRRPTGPATTSVRFETGSLGERKTEVSTSADLGKGASLLFAVAAFNDAGAQQLYFPQLDAPETNFGRAVDMDGRKGYHAFADLTWGNWEILAVTGDRVQIQPVSWGPTIFNDRGTRAEDSRGFLDISYTREFSGDRSLTWRTSYDEYRFRGIYRYASDEGVVDNRERDYGDWLGSKLSYRLPDGFGGHLTIGAEARFDLRALQNVFDVNPDQAQILWIDQPDRFAGFFAQQEWTWGTHWEVNVGGRFDWSRLRPNSFSPRAALIYKPSSRTDVKFLYGRGFRNPSNFEMFFANGFGQLANPSLRAETSNTYEVDVEHEIGKRFRAGASVYRYAVDNLIEQTYDNSGNAQFRNVDRVHAEGVSAELDVLLPAGVEIRSSLEVQHAVYNSGATLSNSPRQVGKLQLSFPFWRDRLEFGAGVQGLGERLDYDGIPIGWAIVPEAVIGTRRLPGGFQFTAGVKNLSNSFYRIPAGLGNDVDSIAAAGRTFYFTAGWTSSETRTDTAKGAPRERIR
ncbi:MAG: TonB-dependent receptor, partial [Acidobacteriia bacterium]|nr:TonB-dependent receptor [Terriglobia bacterium]